MSRFVFSATPLRAPLACVRYLKAKYTLRSGCVRDAVHDRGGVGREQILGPAATFSIDATTVQIAEASRSVKRATRTPYAHPQHEAAQPSTIAIITRFCSGVVNRAMQLICTIQKSGWKLNGTGFGVLCWRWCGRRLTTSTTFSGLRNPRTLCLWLALW